MGLHHFYKLMRLYSLTLSRVYANIIVLLEIKAIFCGGRWQHMYQMLTNSAQARVLKVV